MSKRQLDAENKENEPEQYQSFITTSPSVSNSIRSNEPNPRKKAKIIAATTVSQLEPSLDENNDDDEEEDEEDDDDHDDEEGPWSIGAVIQHNEGKMHPTNKQYIIYDNTEPDTISKTARFWSRKYLKVLQHVDPDTYDMYIHNDFVCYGELEIIENCLFDIANGIFLKHKKQMNFSHYIFAFRRLEALTILLNSCHNFVGIDDGYRFGQIIRVIGACYVTTLRGLLPKSLLDNEDVNDDDMKKLNKISQQLPNFKQVLKQALILGHAILSIGNIQSAYTNILQTIYCNWSVIMDKVRINLNTKPDKKDEDLWEALKRASGIKKSAHRESFNFIKELEHYSKNHPDSGGNSHDLRKWSKARRNLFSFDNTSDEENESFWLQL